MMIKYPGYDISKMLDFLMIFKESGRRPISAAEQSAESQKKGSNIYRFLSLSERDIIYFVIGKKLANFDHLTVIILLLFTVFDSL